MIVFHFMRAISIDTLALIISLFAIFSIYDTSLILETGISEKSGSHVGISQLFYITTLAIIFWHSILWRVLLPNKIISKKTRAVAIRIIDYVWLATAGSGAIFAMHEYSFKKTLQTIHYYQNERKEALSDVLKLGKFPFTAFCSKFAEEGLIDPAVKSSFCLKEGDILNFDEIVSKCYAINPLVSSFGPNQKLALAIYYSKNKPYYDEFRIICRIFVKYGNAQANLNKFNIEEIFDQVVPKRESSRWFVIFMVLLSLRIFKTSAEVIDELKK